MNETTDSIVASSMKYRMEILCRRVRSRETRKIVSTFESLKRFPPEQRGRVISDHVPHLLPSFHPIALVFFDIYVYTHSVVGTYFYREQSGQSGMADNREGGGRWTKERQAEASRKRNDGKRLQDPWVRAFYFHFHPYGFVRVRIHT